MTLIGFIAGGDIQITGEFPAVFPLSLVFILKNGAGEFHADMSIADPHGVQFFSGELPIVTKLQNVNHLLTLNFLNFTIPTPGRYSVVLHLDDRGHVRDDREYVRVLSFVPMHYPPPRRRVDRPHFSLPLNPPPICLRPATHTGKDGTRYRGALQATV